LCVVIPTLCTGSLRTMCFLISIKYETNHNTGDDEHTVDIIRQRITCIMRILLDVILFFLNLNETLDWPLYTLTVYDIIHRINCERRSFKKIKS